MTYALQWVRSLLFHFQIYTAMLVLSIVYFPWAAFSPHGAAAACHTYCRWVMWSAKWMVNLRCEIRGTPPTDEVLVAAKHQSFLDIVMIYSAIPYGKFIMKSELLYVPLFGQYTYRMGAIPVNRGKRGQAITKMLADVAQGAALPGQVVIYPQGTRLAPGVKAPYKVGTAALYEQIGQDCVPVATNAGVFWPRRSLHLNPGVAVVDFLPRIEKGLSKAEFLERLEQEVETASDALLVESGFRG